jgi:hypothetical protein
MPVLAIVWFGPSANCCRRFVDDGLPRAGDSFTKSGQAIMLLPFEFRWSAGRRGFEKFESLLILRWWLRKDNWRQAEVYFFYLDSVHVLLATVSNRQAVHVADVEPSAMSG